MIYLTPQFLFFIEVILFVLVVLMHITKRNITVVFFYATQSFIIASILFSSAFKEASLSLIAASIITFLIKVILAPYFFIKLIKKHQLRFAVSTYLNTPTTLVIVSIIAAFSASRVFMPLAILSQGKGNVFPLAVGMIFVSLFLIINRKGILSQMIGVLSLENAIVSFAYVAGLETTAGMQVGILFDILVWIIIAIIFVSMIYRHFSSLDASNMQYLKEK